MRSRLQIELSEIFSNPDYLFYNSDLKEEFLEYFVNHIKKSELFDAYKNNYDKQTTKNHLECYNQIRLLVFNKFLDTVKDTIINVIQGMDGWENEQSKKFVDLIITNLFIRYEDDIEYERDYDSIIKSYSIYMDFNKHGFEDLVTLRKYLDKMKNENVEDINCFLELLETIDSACIGSPNWKKELTPDQLKFIDMYRTHFLYKTPVVGFISLTSNPQYATEMNYACEYSLEFYNVIFQLYLMGDNKEIQANTLKKILLDYGNPQETYENLIIKLWKWAQNEKGQSRIPSTKLKRFCCDVLQVVSDNNSYARYNSQDFRNVISGWKLLSKQNENIIRKRRPLNPV